MNVIQTDNVFQPPRDRNEPKLQRQFVLPPAMNRHQLESGRVERRQPQQPRWRPTISKSSSCRGTGRERNTITSSSILLSHSRKRTSKGGTVTSTGGVGTSSAFENGRVILALTSGRGDARAEVGMAALDLRCPYLILCQISDSQTYANTMHKLYLFDAIEVVMPDTMCERTANKSVLYRSIVETFPDVQVTPISRIHFNDATGLERIKTLCAAEYSSVELFVEQKYYALASAAAVLKYIEYVQRIVYSPKSMKIEFQGSPNATTIDLESARSLELVQSQCGQGNISLLGILDHCSTPMGKKLLRANILQPPFEKPIILARQSSVAELVFNRPLRALIQPILRRLYGADRLLALSIAPVHNENSVQCAEQNLNYILLLKNLLDAVPELQRHLSTCESELLRKIQERLANPRFQLMKEKILEKIHPDAKSVGGYTSSNMQRCFAIKAGVNDLLDIARQTYCELIDDMKTMVENLASKYKLNLSLACTASLGYHIQGMLPPYSNADTFNPSDEFVEVRKNKRAYTMTTSALAILSQQCKIACEELHLMSNVLLCDLLQDIREYIGCLFQLSADVAELDVISSLAQVSSLQTYVRPTFGNKLEVLDSRHPVMEMFGLDSPVPNSVNASIPQNFYVITGPNMSGKSTYLKQIVLLHIMAQIGCFVPAKKALFRITDHIFCKIAVHDDIECNASSFTLEMKEAQYILRSITPASLIVLDELCKSTAMEEGASIAWAICERILNMSAFAFVATHFSYLTKLSELYYNVTNLHFETLTVQNTSTDDSRQLTYTHQLKPGVAPIDDYGIVLAEFSGLPRSVTEKARSYASKQLVPVDRAATVKDQRNLDWEKTCYDTVVAMHDLLEKEEHDRGELINLIKRIAPLQTLDHAESNAQEDQIKRKEITVQRMNDHKISSNSKSRSSTSFDVTKQYIFGTTASSMISASTVSIPRSNVSAHTFISKNSPNCNLKSDYRTNMYYTPFRGWSNLNDSPVLGSVISNNSSKTVAEQDRQSRESCSLTNSMISDVDLSITITDQDTLSMGTATSMITSLPNLYEYCLSGNDFEPFDTSDAASTVDRVNASQSISHKTQD